MSAYSEYHDIEIRSAISSGLLNEQHYDVEHLINRSVNYRALMIASVVVMLFVSAVVVIW